MVFAHRAYLDIMQRPNSTTSHYDPQFVPDWNAKGTTSPKEMILITQSLKELRLLMSDYVGIVRNNIRLERASRRLDLLHEEIEELYRTSSVSPQLCELRNMITVAYLIVKCAEFREESRGLHYNTDFPGKNELVQNIVM
jgi:L-aspartate oxidase